MSGFSNAVVGGSGILKRIAIRSFNYVTGISGWTINKDGSAEFNNLTIRGAFAGLNFIINSTGAFFYSGVPGLGNIPVAVLGVVATDPFGNDVTPGDASTIGSMIAIGATPVGGTPSYAQLVPGNPAQLRLGSGDPAELAGGTVANFISGSGGGRTLSTLMSSPKVIGSPSLEFSQVGLNSASQDLTQTPTAFLIVSDGSANAVLTLAMDSLKLVGAPIISTNGTPSKPSLITTDTFTSLLPVAVTGYTVSICGYRLEANGMMCFDVQMRANAGGGTAGTYVLTTTLPAQYQPPGTLARTYPLGGNYTLVAANNSGSLLIDEASSANAGRVRVQIAGLPANTDVGCTVLVRLT